MPRTTPSGTCPPTRRSSRTPATTPATGWLGRLGLEGTAFTSELAVSALVTNSIRCGDAPIQLRLIRDIRLICEVSDDSSAALHLRRARVFDESGRGLLLVAQRTERWGPWYGPMGKTIWAEQPLPARRPAL